MDTSKSAEAPQQSGEAASSIISSTQAEQGVSMAQQNEVPSHLISSSQAGQQEFAPPPTWFHGVFPLQNGLWGAQINSIPLGTFMSEIAAARAYDSASHMLSGNTFFRNLLLTNVTIHEPSFQSLYSNEVIFNMIRDGSYEPNYIHFLSKNCPNFHYCESVVMPTLLDVKKGFIFKEMFHKELLLIDVEIQNLFILPHQAISCFESFNSNTGPIWIEFKDRTNQSWKFKLCFVHTPPQYMFTEGWNNFFKEMELCVNDIVLFYQYKDQQNFPHRFSYMIDVIRGVRSPRMQRRRR
ncbi:AP2/ERF and B3 domain-containing transcription factor At1g51120-like [Phalaenopsis equestris]|uniref:AP2/ERF and B3 domain-containing transcription factor At1g51120-like n=1 Tax=Phalaenopsis equestris TaxID=78828 RepID=UPI0009E239F0|nr:AP2/ERF and B3 domain-containing transcription factor At1g51120-like [Phalaenopsis equestris]XP_020585859.1 AP2/ERF and B3 domain-containing transcription factor At1g51120-like [Phalaenopsis equestris]XP_020585860.1 AP2/ERF and B3 domain-containing transcription factor At1g51120-like [Phalaenopsis equestris]